MLKSVQKLEKDRAILEQRLKSYQSRMQELSRIKPKDMAAVAQANLLSDIKEQELKLNLKHPQEKPQESLIPTKINRFERNETDLLAYQKKIGELKKAEKEKQSKHEYEEFRKQMFISAGLRKPENLKHSAEQKFHQRLMDQFEPISKERNRDLLEKLEEGIKRVDSRTDEKPFNELFGEYVEKYKYFMQGIATYHENRLVQGKSLEEIQKMANIACQSKLYSLKKTSL